jgi:hypothetical protein
MTLTWAAIGGWAAEQAAGAYVDYLKTIFLDDAEERRRQDRDMILHAIRELQNGALDLAIAQEINDLRAALQGSVATYAAYDPDPGNAVEEERLRDLIDGLSFRIEEIGGHLDGVGPDLVVGGAVDQQEMTRRRRFAVEIWPLYTPLVLLRAQVMTEREITYGSPEIGDIVPMFDTAVRRNENLLAFLRAVNDRRYPGDIRSKGIGTPHSPRILYYEFDGMDVGCGLVGAPDGMQRCREARRAAKDRTFAETIPVAAILVATDQLREASDALRNL